MRLSVLCALIVLLVCPIVTAQMIGDVSAVRNIPQGVELETAAARVQITALSPTVIRVHYLHGAHPFARTSFAVVANTGFVAPNVRVQQSAGAVDLSTGQVTVHVTKAPLLVSFLDMSGNIVLQDDPRHPVMWSGDEFRITKVMPLDEHYFGLGDKAGPIDHRDQAFTMWNTDAYGWVAGTDPLYKSIPFFLGLRQGKAYGVFLDNTYRSSFDFGKAARDYYSFGSDGGDLDYYFIYGPHPKAVVSTYTALTGRTPLPPRFALGYQQSRYSYFTEADVREVASQLRARNFPADVIYLDIDYQDGRRAFTINREKFPNFEGMVHDLAQQGFKLVTIVDPHLKAEPGYKPYDEGLARDAFVKNPDGSNYIGKVWPGDCVFPDFMRSEVREWAGGLYRDFVQMGVRGFWNDMNEPAVFRYPEKTMPLDTVHSIEGRKTDHREAHNVYGMADVRATYEGVLRLRPDLRPFVLTRAAFAGTQRYAATWTGDNAATWEHLGLSVSTLLSLGVSGYSLSGVDVGGFDSNPTPELLTRWSELGAFYPIFRNHSDITTQRREPWLDGPEHEAIRRRYVQTRYELLPFLYTVMEESSRTGLPFMRPLFMEFPAEKWEREADREFMVGDDLLVAAKVNEKVGPYEVKLPPGVWYDFWSGAQIGNARPFKVDPALDQVPVYVRAGAIIPMQAVTKTVDETPSGPLQLHVFPGPDCRGSLYTDDGNTFAYKKNEFLRMNFTCDAQQNAVRIVTSAAEGTYKPWWNSVAITVFGATAPPRTISSGGKSIADSKFDATAHSVTFTVPASAAASEVLIQY